MDRAATSADVPAWEGMISRTGFRGHSAASTFDHAVNVQMIAAWSHEPPLLVMRLLSLLLTRILWTSHCISRYIAMQYTRKRQLRIETSVGAHAPWTGCVRFR